MVDEDIENPQFLLWNSRPIFVFVIQDSGFNVYKEKMFWIEIDDMCEAAWKSSVE